MHLYMAEMSFDNDFSYCEVLVKLEMFFPALFSLSLSLSLFSSFSVYYIKFSLTWNSCEEVNLSTEVLKTTHQNLCFAFRLLLLRLKIHERN